ncbi:hypothetical protein [Gracilimonas tropica]|uniref:hypothetical protein n=1 Tax=Gracilimonas tropica TaxID=454600 RepID=UPI001B7F9ECE|nr:hypothetical protein [Gracilimonas tropica]
MGTHCAKYISGCIPVQSAISSKCRKEGAHMNLGSLSHRICCITLIVGGVFSAKIAAQELWVTDRVFLQDTLPMNRQDVLINLLDNSLESLADRDRQGRMIGGYILLGLGAGTAVGGTVTLAAAKNDDARIVGYSLLGGGAFLGAMSLLPFKIKSESERLYADFREDLKNSPGEKSQNFYFWDRRFEELAQKRKRERIIGGISSIVAGGVASLAAEDVSDRDRLHIFIWPAVGRVTSFLVRSEEEQRFETYRQAKEDILRSGSVSEIHFGVLPLPKKGLLATIQVRF